MARNFALTTRQLAKLAGVETFIIYSALSRLGHWRGLEPHRLENGRLIWRADKVRRVLGLPQDGDVLDQADNVLLPFLEAVGHRVTPDGYALGLALLDHEPDLGRDPGIVATDEAAMVAEVVAAWCDRVAARLPQMEARDRARAAAALGVIGSAVGSFDTLAGVSDHD